jgi:hypothetical protein
MVVNRLLLWSMIGITECLINVVDLALHIQGLSPISDVRAIAVTASGGLLASVMMYLTFLPPASYRRWIVARHQNSNQPATQVS